MSTRTKIPAGERTRTIEQRPHDTGNESPQTWAIKNPGIVKRAVVDLIDELTAQRDELLATLKAMVNDGNLCIQDEVAAEAAIAKAEGNK